MNSLYNRLVFTLPGLWIEHPDRDFAWEVQLLLAGAVRQYSEAVVACSLFQPFSIEEMLHDPDSTDVQTRAYENALRLLYAKAYIYSLDAAGGFVTKVSKLPMITEQTKIICDEFLKEYGFIKDIRNSLQHIEERTLWKYDKNKLIKASVLNLGGFIDERKFIITIGIGEDRSIEVSEGFLVQVRCDLKKIIWTFCWL